MPGTEALHRRLPIGAEVQLSGDVHFRVWAPRCQQVEIVFSMADRSSALSAGPLALVSELDGYFSGLRSNIPAGTNYGYRLDDQLKLYPDPASRFQPHGPHGLSAIVDPKTYTWSDVDWKGVSLQGQVI